MIIDALFISEWEEGTAETPCKVNTETLEVFDILTVDVSFEHLVKELVVIGGVEYPVFQISDITEEDNEYWYE